METLGDYVEWVANSMGVKLNEENLRKVTNELVEDKTYREALRILEKNIAAASEFQEGN